MSFAVHAVAETWAIIRGTTTKTWSLDDSSIAPPSWRDVAEAGWTPRDFGSYIEAAKIVYMLNHAND